MLRLFGLGIYFSLIIENDAAKILAVFPSASISHQAPFRPLTQELAKRGHEVTVITADPAFPKGKAPKNLREIDVHDVGYKFWKKKISSFATGQKDDIFTLRDHGLDLFSTILEVELAVPEVQELIQNKDSSFDLVLVELCVRPAIVFGHLFKAPVILVSSFGMMEGISELIGAANHPLLYSSISSSNNLMEMSMWQKIKDVYDYYNLVDTYNKHEVVENLMIRKHFGKDTPTLSELRKNVEMVFLNVHPIWENNRPVPPNVVYMGGIHQKPEKELSKDLKSYLDSSRHGVIYFSLGTNVALSSLSAEKTHIMMNVFSKLPYDVLWKYDKDEIPNKPSNIRIAKWFPQSDLLRHPKVKLFITQGGLQSTDEAITAGVPLVGIPMLGDQWLNVGRYIQHKIGVKVDFETITEESFEKSIKTVIEDESYRRNIEGLRDVMRDQPERPLDRAVFWTEHVLRHGGKHLRSPAANMSWIQYYEIQLISVVLLSLLAVVLLFIFAVYTLVLYKKYYSSVKVKIM